jgi:5-formyltetrahydrofolate cyclo-ligase
MSLFIDELRRGLRQRRRQLGLRRQHRAARHLVRAICKLDTYQQSCHIALYLPIQGEIDCRLIMKQAWRDGKACYLPIIKPGAEPCMYFMRHLPSSRLQVNRFGILEPVSGLVCAAPSLDMVLVPLVGFDRHNHRIGMGGGYYDRTFAFHRRDIKPALIGVAHVLQRISNIEPQPWDIRLDRVVAV